MIEVHDLKEFCQLITKTIEPLEAVKLTWCGITVEAVDCDSPNELRLKDIQEASQTKGWELEIYADILARTGASFTIDVGNRRVLRWRLKF